MIAAAPDLKWPQKYDLFGVRVSATSYDEAVDSLAAAARQGIPAVASLHAVHALITASDDRELREMVNTFELIGPDGQPVRWALNLLHKTRLRQRVYGPELMLRLCQRAADEGLPIFLYGGTPEVLEALSANLTTRYPGLEIADQYAPPFRALTADEKNEVIQRMRDSGARLIFIGLGAPKQDYLAHELRQHINAVFLCVGAAFDFHAGVKAMAPAWMQRRGLEWLFRLWQEPRRLWKRYFVTNSLFLWKLLIACCSRRPSASSHS
jgi:exopolysaccharide biosynthesis WecB/TagA/CpsF family protein